MKYWFPLLLALILGANLSAQRPADPLGAEARDSLERIEDTLAVLSHTVFTDTASARRFSAVRELITGLVRALEVEHSFQYPFNRLEHISIQYPADSSFRIFTWQLYVDKDTYRYYGALQKNTEELELYPLIDRSDELTRLEDAELPPDRWYGAVYYTLHEAEAPDGKHYLLFGFDGYRFFRKRKVADVLHFDAEGKPRFGKPVFVKAGAEGALDTTKHRLLLEYSADASVRLNYDPTLDMVVFDHLVVMPGQHGEGPTAYPDGSYEGYVFEDGRWRYVEKIWDEVSDEAPRPFPVLEGKRKDLFGNQ